MRKREANQPKNAGQLSQFEIFANWYHLCGIWKDLCYIGCTIGILNSVFDMLFSV